MTDAHINILISRNCVNSAIFDGHFLKKHFCYTIQIL